MYRALANRQVASYTLNHMDTLIDVPRSESSPLAAAAAGERRYYSISQAAALLGVSRVSIWRWVRDGRLPVARLGHRTARIKQEDLDALLLRGGANGPRSWVAAQRDVP